MALIQSVSDGVVADNVGTTSTSKEKTKGNELGKDEFLKLLVAEMQYQDPLEPSSNTDYVAQLATFSQVEASQNMMTSLEESEANALIGKEVVMRTVSSTTGETNFVQGVVDFVQKDGSTVQLSIDGSLYDIADLYSVIDGGYMAACKNADEFTGMVDQLPGIEAIDLSYDKAVSQVREFFDGLSDYDKKFIDQDVYSKFSQLEIRMNELRALNEYIKKQSESSDEDSDESSDVLKDETTEGISSSQTTGTEEAGDTDESAAADEA